MSTMLGAIVTVPEGIDVPVVYCAQFRRDVEARVGRVVEELPTLVSVQFFGYPHPWDYSIREARQFEVNDDAQHGAAPYMAVV